MQILMLLLEPNNGKDCQYGTENQSQPGIKGSPVQGMQACQLQPLSILKIQQILSWTPS
ncbi:hypothetical protein DPMN_155460 [Dreissena polymorpha]|uniref:Uncharacterized protein n=1 Tax=Dreissena polymorpha TaxID=45954 RepID=A0A9D4JAX7_DREPO|nr:hypothetical protein DPMN_155460 [Dreissena polymorpha]